MRPEKSGKGVRAEGAPTALEPSAGVASAGVCVRSWHLCSVLVCPHHANESAILRQACHPEILRGSILHLYSLTLSPDGCASISCLQGLIEAQVDEYLRAHEETLCSLNQQRLASLDESASLDSLLQQKRREYDEEFGQGCSWASSKKRNTGGGSEQTLDEARPDTASRIAEIQSELAAVTERRALLVGSHEARRGELAQVEDEMALLDAKIAAATQGGAKEGGSVLTLEAQMRRIEASRKTEVAALQDKLKTLTGRRGLEGALRKREQLFNNLISFLQQGASNPTEMQGISPVNFACKPYGTGVRMRR